MTFSLKHFYRNVRHFFFPAQLHLVNPWPPDEHSEITAIRLVQFTLVHEPDHSCLGSRLFQSIDGVDKDQTDYWNRVLSLYQLLLPFCTDLCHHPC